MAEDISNEELLETIEITNETNEEIRDELGDIQKFLEESRQEDQEAEELANSSAEESSQLEQEQKEIQATTIQEIHDYLDLNNHIAVGGLFFIGVFTGILMFKIFWDRFKK